MDDKLLEIMFGLEYFVDEEQPLPGEKEPKKKVWPRGDYRPNEERSELDDVRGYWDGLLTGDAFPDGKIDLLDGVVYCGIAGLIVWGGVGLYQTFFKNEQTDSVSGSDLAGVVILNKS